MEIKDTTINKLEEMQNSFYRNLFNVPFTTPKAALIWEVGGMKMKYRIILNKLLFMNHIVYLDNGTLAKQIQEAQLENDSPGLTKEVQAYMVELNPPNCLLTRIPQMKWKTLVKKAVSQANEK